jgi:dihydroorotate dehydrogenase subfamily 1
MPAFPVRIGKLSLRSPFMLGSGPIGVRAEDLIEYGRVAGAIVTKSISAKPSRGSPQPRIVKIDREGMINYEGGPNPGIEAFADTLREVRPDIPCPIIGSISPRTLTFASGIERVAEAFLQAGADGIELDFKYLYDGAGRTDFQPEKLSSVVKRVRTVAEVPVIAKLTFGAIPLAELARAAEDGGATAISAINAIFPAMRIGLRSRMPTLSMNFGGLSGGPIRPLAIAAIFQLRQATSMPLIGIGGVVNAEDAAEFFMAGANAVQIYTAAQLRGPSIYPRIEAEFASLMAKLKAGSLDEIVGAAHRPRDKQADDHQWDAVRDVVEQDERL